MCRYGRVVSGSAVMPMIMAAMMNGLDTEGTPWDVTVDYGTDDSAEGSDECDADRLNETDSSFSPDRPAEDGSADHDEQESEQFKSPLIRHRSNGLSAEATDRHQPPSPFPFAFALAGADHHGQTEGDSSKGEPEHGPVPLIRGDGVQSRNP
jgi:hypothetical protein